MLMAVYWQLLENHLMKTKRINMKPAYIISIICIVLLLTACSKDNKLVSFEVRNTLYMSRTFETVELSKEFLGIDDLNFVEISDADSGEQLISQVVDINGDGVMDKLLFQPKLNGLSKKTYNVISVKSRHTSDSEIRCYSRFVPERTDDYAWENNKVAYRVYGPDAQRRFENNLKEGTLSSGVDAWLKRVEYPIINKWYKKYSEKTGTYHEDTGEGLDNFHVGVSRGVGGIAKKVDSTYYYSKNFTKWKTITTGPIRTSFYLEYANWDAGGNLIKESKIISLDYGNNLSKFELNIDGVDTISAGLTLHEKDGLIKGNIENGWVSYWQPIDDSEIGTAIVAPKDVFVNYETYNTNTKDLSNAYANLKVKNNSVTYYAGFGWKKSGQFKNQKEWVNYLNMFAEKIEIPLEISIVKD